MKPMNLIEFTLVFAQEIAASDGNAPIYAPHVLAEDIEKIRKLAMELERLNLNACNYGLSNRQETRRENIIKALTYICAGYGIGIVTQDDPRGAAFGILCKHTQRHNSWGGQESGFRLMFEGK